MKHRVTILSLRTQTKAAARYYERGLAVNPSTPRTTFNFNGVDHQSQTWFKYYNHIQDRMLPSNYRSPALNHGCLIF